MPAHFFNNTTITASKPIAMPAVGQVRDTVFEEFGTLYKHCKSLHLPKVGRTLRLGTLSEYRRNENKAVRDKDEGMFRITLNFPNLTRVGIDGLKTATFDTSPLVVGIHEQNLQTNFFVGRFTTGSIFSTDNVVIESRTEKDINLSGTIDIYAEGADAYVLCLSRSGNPGSVILDPEYDSVWAIRVGNVLNLTKELASILSRIFNPNEFFLKETVGPLDTPGFSPPPLDEELVFTVSAEVRTVEYRDKVMEIKTDISDEIALEVHQCLDKSAFIKPTALCLEEEIRILFRPVFLDKRNGSRYLFPNYLRPIFVPFDSLLDFVEIVSEPLVRDQTSTPPGP